VSVVSAAATERVLDGSNARRHGALALGPGLRRYIEPLVARLQGRRAYEQVTSVILTCVAPASATCSVARPAPPFARLPMRSFV